MRSSSPDHPRPESASCEMNPRPASCIPSIGGPVSQSPVIMSPSGPTSSRDSGMVTILSCGRIIRRRSSVRSSSGSAIPRYLHRAVGPGTNVAGLGWTSDGNPWSLARAMIAGRLEITYARLGLYYSMHYRWDTDRAEMVFNSEGVAIVRAGLQLVGTLSGHEGTWLWGCANESVSSAATCRLSAVREYGQELLDQRPQGREPRVPLLRQPDPAIEGGLAHLRSPGALRPRRPEVERDGQQGDDLGFPLRRAASLVPGLASRHSSPGPDSPLPRGTRGGESLPARRGRERSDDFEQCILCFGGARSPLSDPSRS